MKKEELLKKYLESIVLNIDTRPTNLKNLTVFAVVGLPGSGKSTLAKYLQEHLGIFIASNDHIRRYLNQEGYIGDNPKQDYVQYIAESVTDYLYTNNISHFIDADILKFYSSARSKAENNNARFILLKINCPEKAIISRLKKRTLITSDGGNELSRANIDEYRKRKQIHALEKMPKFDFEFNCKRDFSKQVVEMCDKLKILS